MNKVNVNPKAERECRSLFYSNVLLIVIIASELFADVWDVCEERKLIKFKQGVQLKKTKSCFDRVDAWVKKLGSHASGLLYDTSVQVQKKIEKPLSDLYSACQRYFEENGQPDAEFKSMVQVCMVMIELSKELFDAHFASFLSQHGYDIRKDYLPVRVGDADTNFFLFADNSINAYINNLKPTEDEDFVRCFNVLADILFDKDIIDEASIVAIKMNQRTS